MSCVFMGMGGEKDSGMGVFLRNFLGFSMNCSMNWLKNIVLPYTVNKWLFLEGSYFSVGEILMFTKEIVE